MKTTNAVRSLVLEINRLDVRSSFAVGRAKNHIDPILDGKFDQLAALLRLSPKDTTEAYGKLVAIALMPLKEEGRVSRMARPVATMPVVAPRLTLTGV